MNAQEFSADEVYAFAMRGLLTEEALDRVGRKRRVDASLHGDEAVSRAISITLLDAEQIARARRMALVYTAIAAFENSVRDLVSSVLLEHAGEDWWARCVSQKIRSKAESRMKDEERYKWHTARGNEPLDFTDFGELGAIIQQNWEFFEPHVQSAAWVDNIFKTLERSRNVIMHSGTLEMEDVERVGMNIRDWVRQVGA